MIVLTNLSLSLFIAFRRGWLTARNVGNLLIRFSLIIFFEKQYFKIDWNHDCIIIIYEHHFLIDFSPLQYPYKWRIFGNIFQRLSCNFVVFAVYRKIRADILSYLKWSWWNLLKNVLKIMPHLNDINKSQGRLNHKYEECLYQTT